MIHAEKGQHESEMKWQDSGKKFLEIISEIKTTLDRTQEWINTIVNVLRETTGEKRKIFSIKKKGRDKKDLKESHK